MKNRQSISVGFGRIAIPTVHGKRELFSYTFENEFMLDEGFLYAPRIGGHINLWLLYFGASTAVYTNFSDRTCWTFNPELGVGFIFAFIIWNPTITIADFGEKINQHNLTLKVIIPLESP